jgi:hypothetical protein
MYEPLRRLLLETIASLLIIASSSSRSALQDLLAFLDTVSSTFYESSRASFIVCVLYMRPAQPNLLDFLLQPSTDLFAR